MGFGIYSLYRKWAPGFREKRVRLFLDTFQPNEKTSILDVGGIAGYWRDIPISSPVTVLNLGETDSTITDPSRFTYVQGDGRSLPFDDQSFDIVYSNSVIEHLYTGENQERLAAEIQRVGRGIFVQTPNRWFPIEPHFITLFFHYFPKTMQKLFLPHFSFRGIFRSGDNIDLRQLLRELRLLSRRQLRKMFPGCEIWSERLLGLAKSLMAVRRLPT